MLLALILLALLAFIFGLVTAAKWLLIVAVVLVILAVLSNLTSGRRSNL